MTVPYSSDIYQAVVPGGQVTFLQRFETFYGSGFPQTVSSPSITITPGAGRRERPRPHQHGPRHPGPGGLHLRLELPADGGAG